MGGAANLMPRIEEARSGHHRAEELLSEARGMLGKPEEQAPKPEEGGGWLDKLKGAGHTLLDAAGFIPVVGAAADLANAAWYAAEGDYTNAAFSAASAVPGVGDAFAAGKVAVKVAGATGGVAAVAGTAKGLSSTKKTFITYTLRDEQGVVKYVGKARGKGTPKQVMQQRISKKHDVLKANPTYKPKIESIQGNAASNAGAEDVLYNYHKHAQGLELDNKIPPLSDKPWKARTKGRSKVEAYNDDNAPGTGLYDGEQL